MPIEMVTDMIGAGSKGGCVTGMHGQAELAATQERERQRHAEAIAALIKQHNAELVQVRLGRGNDKVVMRVELRIVVSRSTDC